MSNNTNKRVSIVERKTNETNISVKINLDGQGKGNIKTGLPFFDHMIEQLSKHSLIDIDLIDIKNMTDLFQHQYHFLNQNKSY